MLTLEHKRPTSRGRSVTQPAPQQHTLSQSADPVIQRAPSCPCGGSCPRCLAKSTLKIGAPDDAYEREADTVADRVMRMADGAVPVTAAASGLQRKCAACDKESEGPLLQPVAESLSASAPPSAGPTSAPGSVDAVLRSTGQALDFETRAFFEPRFGRDFAAVQVHFDPAAQQSARDVNARAYTVAHHIVFSAGRFAPGTSEGRRLLAHELAHVVQQSGAEGGRVGPRDEKRGLSPFALAPSRGTVQRQLDPRQTQGTGEPPSLFTIFIADPHKRLDKRFARQQGEADAARIQLHGTLSLEDRQLVNAKLRFFEGDAKEAYTRQIKPALVLATRPEIELQPAYVGKVPDAEPAEQARIRRRRERTLRFFAKLKDHQLEEAYVSRLQRYLDEGMEANAYWDVEMIEQIIEERAPNAPWHEAARQDFLAKRAVKLRTQEREKSLTKLSPYWQNQFGALAEQTGNWKEEHWRAYARDLLWKWYEQVAKYNDNPYLRDVVQPAVAEEMIFKDIVEQYELQLRVRDRAIQDECRRHPPGRLMKVWGDPCKPWFEDSSQRGEQELRHLERRLRIFKDENRVPYRDIVFWVDEYRKRVEALPTRVGEVHRDILQSWSMVQGGLGMANKPVKIPSAGVGRVTPSLGAGPTAPALPSRSQAQLPPGAAGAKVGDIISPPAELGLGPQRVVAVLPEGELLKPVAPMPPANRALPTGTQTAGSAVIKSPRPTPPAPRVPAQLPEPTVPAPLVPRQVLKGEMPPAQKQLPPAPDKPIEQPPVGVNPAKMKGTNVPEKGTEKEKRLLDADKPARVPSATYFSWTAGARRNFFMFAAALRKYAKQFKQRVGTPGAETLNMSTRDFIKSKPELQKFWDATETALTDRLDKLRIEMRKAGSDRATLSALRKQEAALEKKLSKLTDWANNAVGKKRPDLVEVFPDERRIVVFDITQRPFDPPHNFKTQFYEEVLKDLTGWSDVHGIEFATAKVQKVLGK